MSAISSLGRGTGPWRYCIPRRRVSSCNSFICSKGLTVHRVHHSIDPRETNSNYGFNLPWWDWLLGTYIAQPAKGHEEMEIGIEQFRTRRDLWLDRMLIQPVRGPASGHAVDPRNTTKEPAE